MLALRVHVADLEQWVIQADGDGVILGAPESAEGRACRSEV